MLNRIRRLLLSSANRTVRAAWLAAGATLVLAGILMLGFFRLFYDTRLYRYKMFRTKADPKTTEGERARLPGRGASDAGGTSARASRPITFTAHPNPAHVSDGSGRAVVTLHWSAPDAIAVNLRVNSPDGPLVAAGGDSATLTTEQWVRDGMVFFLHDVSRGDSPARRIPIGQLAVAVVDPLHDEWVRAQNESHQGPELVADSGSALYGVKRVAVTFSPASVRPGERYGVRISAFAGQVIDVGYELTTKRFPAPVVGVVTGWCELDSQGEASILTPADHVPGIVRITKVRSRSDNSGWHPARGEIQVAGGDEAGADT